MEEGNGALREKASEMSILQRLKMRIKRPRGVERLEVIGEKCVGCGRCAKMCKRGVFAMEGRRAVVANADACVGCGKCVQKICGFGAIDLVVANNGVKR